MDADLPFIHQEGITPRVARVAPGQAVVFAVYEKVQKWIETLKTEIVNSDYTEA